MKPASLSPEFYRNLYKSICESDIDADMSDDTCSAYLEFNIDGLCVSLTATFEVNVIDDSFDHAFGTEHAWHCEVGELTDIDEVLVATEDNEDVTSLFSYDAFFDQFKLREYKFTNGRVVKCGDTVLGNTGRNRAWMSVQFLYFDTLNGRYVCKLADAEDTERHRFTMKSILPDTEQNRKALRVA